jgi:transposase
VPAGSATSRSQCERWRPQILEALSQGLSAQRIFQDLVREFEFTGSYDAVKRFVRLVGRTTELPFRRMESAPGEEMQVDFGQGAWVVDTEGRKRRPHLFRAVLSHSRKGYAEVVWTQSTESFLRCMENAYRAFGGVAAVTIIDNLKAGVLRADWFDPELNPRTLAFAEHYGTAILPTKPAMPRHKGKVEAGVDYVQENALKGRRFRSLVEQNDWLAHWERTVADTRIHGTVRQQVGVLFQSVELPKLRPLPASLFPSFVDVRRSVHRDGHVEYKRAFYSAPPEYVGRRIWVRADSTMIRLFNDKREPIGVHARREKGFGTADEHIHAHKRSGLERGADYLLNRCRCVGPATGAWAQAMFKQRGVYGLRPLQGLLSLSRKNTAEAMERAATMALQRGSWRLHAFRTLLKDEGKVVQGEFVQQHPIIRDLSAYRVAFPS